MSTYFLLVTSVAPVGFCAAVALVNDAVAGVTFPITVLFNVPDVEVIPKKLPF